MRLTDEQLRDVLARAEEIQRESRYGDEISVDLETVIGAAEEMGLTRPVVERALRERLALSAPPRVGELTFAQSENGKFYVARVLSISTEGAQVRFLGGGEHHAELDQLRRCAFMPGEKVTVNWPWWGPWTCTVVGYDARTQHVTLSDGWGSNETFPISEVWLAPARDSRPGKARRRVYVTLLGAGAGIGALIGSIVTSLMMRGLLLFALVSCAPAAPAPAVPDPVFLPSADQAMRGLPFSDAVRVGDLLFLSGKIGTIPGKTELAPGGIAAETRQTMENIKATLLANGSSLDRVVKCTVMLADIREWAAMNEVYVPYFPNHRPARSSFGASGLALNARVEIECIAAAGPRSR